MRPALLRHYYYSSSRGGYSDEAQAVFANMDSQPPTALKNAMATFIDSQVTAGNWDKMIDFVYLGMDTQANSLSGWKGAIAATLGSTAYWTKYTDCYTNGTLGSYIDTGFIPNDHAAWGLNDSGFGVFCSVNRSNNTTGSKNLFGCQESADLTRQIIMVQSGTGGSNLIFRFNTDSTNTSTTENVFDDAAMYALDKTSATTIHLIKNGATVETKTVVNGSKATIPLYLGGNNTNGTQTSYIDASYKAYFAYNAVGFDYTSFYNDLVTLNTAVNNILSDIVLVLDIGQSNSGGAAELNRTLGLTSYVANQPGVKVFYKTAYNTTNDGHWRKMVIGENNAEVALEPGSNIHGAEMSLSHSIYTNKNLPVYYVKAARSGAGLGTKSGTPPDDWNPTNAGECYDIAVDGYLLPAITELQREHPGRTIKIILLWHQGEGDQDGGVNQAAYQSNLEAFVTALRAESALLTNAPFIVTKLHYNLTVDEDAINTALAAYVAGADNAYIIDPAADAEVLYPRKMDLPAGITTPYPPTLADDKHNSFQFQHKKGELIYSKLVEIGYI